MAGTTLRKKCSCGNAVGPIVYRRVSGVMVDRTDIDTAFPEYRFEPSEENRAAYEARVRRGYEVLRRNCAVIAGLARNVAHVLPKTIARIERLGSLFADYRVVIYENDSSDETPVMLSRWAKQNSKVTAISERRGAPVNRPTRCLERAARMAHYRNVYHRHIAKHYGDYDVTVVVDTDLVDGWSYDGIANTFGHQGWDFVGSYGIIHKRIGKRPNVPIHYDAWAFRNYGDFSPLSTKAGNAMRWSRGDPLLSVYSCFGGLGIYRTGALLSGRYKGGDTEHLALHRAMRRRGFDRLYLNPSQITLYGRKHRRMDRVVWTYHKALAACGVQIMPKWY